MSQLKLLNFHKMIANFATNLVSAFVPLIIYQATNSLLYAVIYLVANNAVRYIFTFALHNLYNKYPQLLLLLRLVPIILYNVFIFILDVNLIVGVIGVCIFTALDYAVNNLSKEIIFNYASLSQSQNSDKTIGITRLFEQIGIIVALLVGGYLLDINQTLVLILSLVIYAVSVVPLVMFYIKSRHEKTFNKDATSNAIDTLSKNDEHKKESKKLTKKLLITYGIIYASFAFLDLLQTVFSMSVFIQKGEFATAGILNAIFNCTYAVGFYVAGLINDKFDTTKLVSIYCIIIGLCVIALPFINVDTLFILICLIYGIIGFTYPMISLFVLERMLIKSRIMACSNLALFTRETGCVFAYVIGYAFGFFGVIGWFIIISVTMIGSGFIIPAGEERTRQNLVDFLQNNEKAQQNKAK